MGAEQFAVVGPGQARVLQVLRGLTTPADAAEIGALTGLGGSTLRTHLMALAEAGLVSRIAMRTGRRGRPRWVYRARDENNSALIRSLARAITAATAPSSEGSPAMVPQAIDAGRPWGEEVAAELGDLVTPDTSTTEQLAMALEHGGFAHEPDRHGLRITHCPLLDLALDNRAVVCAAHLGMLQGVLSDPHDVDVVPFDVDGGCLVRTRSA